MYIGQIRSIFPINYLASSLHIKTLSLLCLQWSSTHFNPNQCSSNFFAQCADKSVLFFLFGDGLREGWDSTYKRVLLHRIKLVTKSYKKNITILVFIPKTKPFITGAKQRIYLNFQTNVTDWTRVLTYILLIFFFYRFLCGLI